jgi:hypothetical protein
MPVQQQHWSRLQTPDSKPILFVFEEAVYFTPKDTYLKRAHFIAAGGHALRGGH